MPVIKELSNFGRPFADASKQRCIAVCLNVADGTGNLLLAYGGSVLVPFGLLTLVVRRFIRGRSDAGSRP